VFPSVPRSARQVAVFPSVSRFALQLAVFPGVPRFAWQVAACFAPFPGSAREVAVGMTASLR
jgi:hypothetical protein